MTAEPELVETLKKIRYDLTALQGKVSEALRQAAALNIEPDAARHRCSLCGLTFKAAVKLAEHGYHAHGADPPAQWVEAETRTA